MKLEQSQQSSFWWAYTQAIHMFLPERTLRKGVRNTLSDDTRIYCQTSLQYIANIHCVEVVQHLISLLSKEGLRNGNLLPHSFWATIFPFWSWNSKLLFRILLKAKHVLYYWFQSLGNNLDYLSSPLYLNFKRCTFPFLFLKSV